MIDTACTLFKIRLVILDLIIWYNLLKYIFFSFSIISLESSSCWQVRKYFKILTFSSKKILAPEQEKKNSKRKKRHRHSLLFLKLGRCFLCWCFLPLHTPRPCGVQNKKTHIGWRIPKCVREFHPFHQLNKTPSECKKYQ